MVSAKRQRLPPKRRLDLDRSQLDVNFVTLRSDRVNLSTSGRVNKSTKTMKLPVTKTDIASTANQLADLLNKV
jgi:hypothetical protein